jgi:cytochrome c553
MLFVNYLSVRLLKIVVVTFISLIMIACGGSGGGSGNTTTTPESQADVRISTFKSAEINYNGPAPRDATVQRYRSAIWQNVAQETRCGACHVVGGAGASVLFSRLDDVNLAYDTAIANTLINTSAPASSRLVTKVGEGHNCWLNNVATCVSLMTGWVQDFTTIASGTSFLAALNLQEPVSDVVGASKQFPADVGDTDFATTIHPITLAYCSTCHAENTALKQQPFIASADPQVAYDGARTRINLSDETESLSAAISRITVRLRDEGHNCWTDCATSSGAMHDAIVDFADSINVIPVDTNLVVSRQLNINDDGQAAGTGGARVETNVIAKWDFRGGAADPSSRRADDSSGIDPAITLNFDGNVEWLAAGGVNINDGSLRASVTNSVKLYDRITVSGEYSIEAWVIPLNVTQDGPASIVSYSGGSDRLNFTMGQSLYSYDSLARSSATDGAGIPAVSTPNADEVLQATLQHVVLTYSATEGRKIYVDGQLIVDDDPQGPGNFSSWDENFSLILGSDASNANPWQGAIRFLAIHDGAMLQEDVQTNFDIGVGQTFYLLFEVSDVVSIASSYIALQVQQFDNFGYLFNEPFFVTFDSLAVITDTPIQGIRIGINGSEATVGQAYANVDTTITQTDVDAGEGRQVLSTIGTVIAVDQGPANDTFFLTFDRLGAETYFRTPSIFPVPVPTADAREQSAIGIKTFDEINEALSSLSGISKTTSSVADTFAAIRQQLPINEDIQGFVAAQQLAITQLAVSYCSALTAQEAGGSPQSYYSAFDFGTNVAGAFDAAGRNELVTPLLNNLLADNLTDQPDIGTLADDSTQAGLLDNLIDDLISSCDADSNCTQDNARVLSMVTAACSSTFGSAMMLLQ